MNHSIFAALVLLSATNVIAQQPVTGTKPRVHVLATGGTISNMGSDPRRTGAELVAGITGLSEIAGQLFARHHHWRHETGECGWRRWPGQPPELGARGRLA
jgi:L-asparaginase/Glu-tRNA(Gln) amidotransferase subunit D